VDCRYMQHREHRGARKARGQRARRRRGCALARTLDFELRSQVLVRCSQRSGADHTDATRYTSRRNARGRCRRGGERGSERLFVKRKVGPKVRSAGAAAKRKGAAQVRPWEVPDGGHPAASRCAGTHHPCQRRACAYHAKARVLGRHCCDRYRPALALVAACRGSAVPSVLPLRGSRSASYRALQWCACLGEYNASEDRTEAGTCRDARRRSRWLRASCTCMRDAC
jgi:hypothetical protein